MLPAPCSPSPLQLSSGVLVLRIDLERAPVEALRLGALALHLPSLGMGFYADDHVHQLALAEPELGLPMRPWSLYDFGTRHDW